MKRIISFIILLALTVFFSFLCFAADIFVTTPFSAVTIVASGTSTSSAYDLKTMANNGFFGVQITLTGTGTGKLEYLLSSDGTNYLEPSTATDVISGFTATSGPGSDGKTIVTFEPELARYLKLKWTETGGANSIIVTTTFVVQ